MRYSLCLHSITRRYAAFTDCKRDSQRSQQARLQIIFLPFFSFAAKYMFYGALAFDTTFMLLRRGTCDAPHCSFVSMRSHTLCYAQAYLITRRIWEELRQAWRRSRSSVRLAQSHRDAGLPRAAVL